LGKQSSTDTSDAAYEKRHRKYELLEKRQRLREKEQLKHEQYKLKERIDQLRSMDAAAFLALPSSPFASISPRQNEPGRDGDDDVVGSSPEAHVNGSPTNNEGERRRKEMLEVAITLEERYRTLLLPKGVEKGKKSSRQSSVVTSMDLEGSFMGGRHHEDGESEVDPDEPREEVQREKERLKLKIKVPPRLSSRHTTGAPTYPLHSRTRSKYSYHVILLQD
jgi:hypothetical protein